MIESCLWPKSRLAEAMSSLIEEARLNTKVNSAPPVHPPGEQIEIGDFIEWRANISGCTADPLELDCGQLEARLPGLCPLLVAFGGDNFIPVLAIRGNFVLAVAPDGAKHSILASGFYRALRTPTHAGIERKFTDLLVTAGLPNESKLLNRFLKEQVSGRPCRVGWRFQGQPKSGWLGLIRESSVIRNGYLLVAAHLGQYLLWLTSWSVLGRLSLRGQMDTTWLAAWSLLLFSLIPLRVFTTYAQGILAVSVGAALKRRLLLGAMRIDPQQAREKGIGNILSQVFESEAVESLALNGGVSGVLAFTELLVAAVVLGPMSLLLLIFAVITGAVLYLFARRYQDWTGTRMRMSEGLVELMVGHRTRAAQQPPDQWHLKEDADLDEYLRQSRRVDGNGASLVSAVPRLWLLSAITMLAPYALSGTAGQSTVALRLGGVLMAFGALQRLTAAAIDIAGTFVAARRISPLLHAADRKEIVGSVPPETAHSGSRGNIVEAEKVEFRYQAAGSKQALHSTNFAIGHGERVLLEGPSGGGKSTLSALLAGTRQPAAGLLLAGGLDRFTLGEAGWRKQVAVAPQFHENHILTETLAFNLLMGRPWPPRESDLDAAESLCRELGLGPLLYRMPSGLMQMVGEGGWQLSHGERSRVFLARALLQGSSLTILDESFGALDPETTETALQCTLAHTDALMVIAHP